MPTTRRPNPLLTPNERESVAAARRPPWPDPIPDAALHGPAGDFVRSARDHTEGDPNGLYVAALTGAGLSLSQWRPHLRVGDRWHRPLLFTALVGRSSKARKGTATDPVHLALTEAEGAWADLRSGGFGSGEAFVEALAERPRLLLDEQELAAVLITCARDGSTLGQSIRLAWDGSPLRRRTVKRTTTATDYAVAVIASCTLEELERALSTSDLFGGTTNRFLWVAVERSGLKPRTSGVPTTVTDTFAAAIKDANSWLEKHALASNGEPMAVRRSADAERLWADEGLYATLENDDESGALGAAVARSSVQVLRVALVFALLDLSATIERDHLRAAEAVWNYCRASAAHVFGESTGDHRADRVLDRLRIAGESGLLRSEVPAAIGNKGLTRAHVDRLRDRLVTAKRIVVTAEPSAGRTGERWRIARDDTSARSSRSSRQGPTSPAPSKVSEGRPGNNGKKSVATERSGQAKW